jgi:hypothetical protein
VCVWRKKFQNRVTDQIDAPAGTVEPHNSVFVLLVRSLLPISATIVPYTPLYLRDSRIRESKSVAR